MSSLKEAQYRELELKAHVSQEGITFDPAIFDHADVGGEHQEQVHCLFEYDTDTHVGLELPPYLVLPHGLVALFNYNRRSPNRLERDGKRFFLVRRDGEAIPVEFAKRPRYYRQETSDGTQMRTVAVHNTDGVVFVAYSNECSLKSTGKDCLFCNINATRDTYGDAEGVRWKYPRQIGETIAAAYAEGARHLTISGGFVPERREVDYYLDVAESIKEQTGLEDFNGTACIGAPQDLSIIEKYKEVGYRTLAINIEVWNEHFFRAYCPGKEQLCGGQKHWIAALEHAVGVFGRGRVRSNMVGGLESKQSTLEGIEALTAKGIIAISPAWFPNPGSALEGHRSPEPEWHLDVARKTVALYRKVGFTWDQIYDANAAPTTLVHDIYRIEEGRLPAPRKAQATGTVRPATEVRP
ncbi:radical SAM protein [Anaeromyxobacter oryzae]|uniref:Radical SAM protein n=1 Tax=Anaeromyxobacter oryzae TaxID=2918170 RepID=A0ABM7WSD8_9BACT|nr:radical SAM protein [Anaeromyxobacter oryzae]BDG02385.1 radical SAM protein [Anaeromyxobacter oryzae]